MILLDEDFEGYTEANEPSDTAFPTQVKGKAADRGGNWRVNMPGHSAPYAYYDPAGVHRGTKSIHCWGEKAWRWGYSALPRLPYGEQDVLTGQWLTPQSGRPLLRVKDIPFDSIMPAIPDADIAAIATAISPTTGNGIVLGNYHWERDWIDYVGGQHVWNGGALLVEPRSRIVNNPDSPGGGVGYRDEVYMRIHFKPINFQGCGMQILRFVASDYVARVEISPGQVSLAGYGQTWAPTPAIGDRYWSIPGGFKPGRFYYIELGFKRGNPGGFRVWFGEEGAAPQLIMDFWNLNTLSAPTPYSFQTGIVDIFDFVWDYLGESTYAVCDMFFDDWAIGDSYIGPAPAGVSHLLQVQAPVVPGGVPVTLDGSPIGNTPISTTIGEGAHTLSVPQEVVV